MIYFLFIWLVVMLWVNFFPKSSYWKKLNREIPIWEFFFHQWQVFSPEPFFSDLNFYYRDQKDEGEYSSLKEKVFFTNKRLMLLFYIDHRERKFIYSLYNVLAKKENNQIKNSMEYACLKKHFYFYGLNKTSCRQICIVRTHGYISELEDKIELIDNL